MQCSSHGSPHSQVRPDHILLLSVVRDEQEAVITARRGALSYFRHELRYFRVQTRDQADVRELGFRIPTDLRGNRSTDVKVTVIV